MVEICGSHAAPYINRFLFPDMEAEKSKRLEVAVTDRSISQTLFIFSFFSKLSWF